MRDASLLGLFGLVGLGICQPDPYHAPVSVPALLSGVQCLRNDYAGEDIGEERGGESERGREFGFLNLQGPGQGMTSPVSG